MRVRHRVRPDLDSALPELSKTIPVQRRELRRVRGRLGGELGNIERTPLVGVRSACEDRGWNPESLEYGDRGRDTAEGVVEGDGKRARGPSSRVGCRGRAVTASEKAAQLLLEAGQWYGQVVFPRIGDRVVAEDPGSVGAKSWCHDQRWNGPRIERAAAAFPSVRPRPSIRSVVRRIRAAYWTV